VTLNGWGREAVCLTPGDLVRDSLAKDPEDIESSDDFGQYFFDFQ
jgi:hypothetical protein